MEPGYEIVDFPTSVGIQTVDFCGHRCAHCPLSAERDAGRITKGVMTVELLNNILDELAENEPSLKRVNLYALNDPLSDERIVELVRIARNKLPSTTLGLSTSGILNFTPEFYFELKDAGLSTLFVSIPSLDPEGYKKIMNMDALHAVLDKIDLCISKENSSIIRIGVPVTDGFNLEDFKEYFEKERNLPVDVWAVENRGGLNIHFSSQVPKKISQDLKDYGLKWKRCDRPLDMANIMYDGRVILCCADWRKEIILGNVSTHTLREIWCGKTARDIQRKISSGDYDSISLCRGCSENPRVSPYGF